MTRNNHGSPLENWVRNIRDVMRLHGTELNAIEDTEARYHRPDVNPNPQKSGALAFSATTGSWQSMFLPVNLGLSVAITLVHFRCSGCNCSSWLPSYTPNATQACGIECAGGMLERVQDTHSAGISSAPKHNDKSTVNLAPSGKWLWLI